jgi:hypothetical protein
MPRVWEECGNQRMTDKQRKMLNSVCGDLARSIEWHGWRLSKDDWRHFFSGLASGLRIMRGWDFHDGHPPGLVMLGRSSLELTRSQAKDAITLAIHFGDDPAEQGLPQKPVAWSDATLRGMGFNPEELK